VPVALSVTLLIAACVGSSTQKVTLKVPRRSQTLAIPSFGPTKESLSAQDWRNGRYRTAGDHVLTKDLGTHSFDDSDFQNLRQSLIQSLQAASAFGEIVDANGVGPEAPPTPGAWRLRVEFELTGMKQTPFTSTCLLKGTCSFEGPDGRVVRAQKVDVVEDSLMTVSAAKNSAIESFVEECAKSLAQPTTTGPS
jgi:hypothetical protein